MRTASKLLLLCATAVLAMAFAASSASATGPVEISNEITGEHCNPCEIVVEGESVISVETPRIPVSFCEDSFEAEIYEDGEGHVTQLNNANHTGGACATQKCNGVGEPAAETEWPFHMEEVGSAFALAIRFCLDSKAAPNNPGGHCDLTAGVAPEPAPRVHHYLISAVDEHCTAINRVWNSDWEIHDTFSGTGNHDAIEILHDNAS
jgi:hypothetical protein